MTWPGFVSRAQSRGRKAPAARILFFFLFEQLFLVVVVVVVFIKFCMLGSYICLVIDDGSKVVGSVIPPPK